MVVRAGLTVVEAEGLDAVTIRRVAAELGSAPMALYRHVADKRELVFAMLDDMAQRIPPAPTEGEPVECLITGLLEMHHFLAEHVWLVEVLIRGEMFSPHSLDHFDRLLAILDGLGFDTQEALAIYTSLWWFMMGHLATAAAATPARDASRRAIAALAPLETLPHAAAAFAGLADYDHEAAFRTSLRVFITALVTR